MFIKHNLTGGGAKRALTSVPLVSLQKHPLLLSVTLPS